MVGTILLTLLLAAPATTQPGEAEAERHAAALSAEAWGERRAATQALRRLGESARPVLEEVAAGDDAEAATRAKVLLRELDAEDVLAATPITLKLDAVPPADALERLEDLIGTGFDVDYDMLDGPPVSMDLADVPLLEAVRQVMPAVGVQMDAEYGVSLHPWGDDGWEGYPAVDAGAVRIEARSIRLDYQPYVDLSGQQVRQDEKKLRFTFLAMTEPKLSVFEPPTLKVTELRLPGGKTLEPVVDPFTRFGHNVESRVFHSLAYSAGVESIDDLPEKLERLAGEVVFSVTVQSLDVEADDPQAEGLNQTIKGTTLQTTAIFLAEDQWRVDVTIDNTGPMSSDDRFLELLHLVLADGTEIAAHDHEIDRQWNHVTAKLCFGDRDLENPPVKLLWRVPIEVEERVVPFEFRDLPLPR
jgi:hypothetical protein